MGTYNMMWNYMAANPEVFTKSNKEGIERVKETNGGKNDMNFLQTIVLSRVCISDGKHLNRIYD